jgi:hypothetical protein
MRLIAHDLLPETDGVAIQYDCIRASVMAIPSSIDVIPLDPPIAMRRANWVPDGEVEHLQ